MLAEIRCSKFRRNPAQFKSGLNVITGDNVATNSIGKSTFLMVVDFVFGGNTFLSTNADVISELGHHKYLFKFRFDNREFYFFRDTGNPDRVFQCGSDYTSEGSIDVKEFREFLQKHYNLSPTGLSFRSIASLFTRVWGRDNLNPKRPLDPAPKARGSDSIEFLLKLYLSYNSIEPLATQYHHHEDKKNAIKKAQKQRVIPQISKTAYTISTKRKQTIDEEFSEIRKELSRSSLSISKLSSKEVKEIKFQKDDLTQSKIKLESRLNRATRSLKESRYITSKTFKPLKELFPGLDTERLSQVEEFHSAISRILKKEIEESIMSLTVAVNTIDEEINRLDDKLSSLLKDLDNPKPIIDKVYSLAREHEYISSTTQFYEALVKHEAESKKFKIELQEETNRQLSNIQNLINEEIQTLTAQLYGEQKKSPHITLNTNNYTFDVFEDTGTGTAYANLILLDLSVASTANIPVLIHDSVLFKNIENMAVSRILQAYNTLKTQIFISIDETDKYGEAAMRIIDANRVLDLSNTSVLYTKDWRRKPQEAPNSGPTRI
ncbi:MAG: DUF2326 domain-containing protein [Verrucomicrobiota bacterium JB022]|nr:DUF2326 domain-containing protein [Verrucomicrobiota bacterium JB022]